MLSIEMSGLNSRGNCARTKIGKEIWKWNEKEEMTNSIEGGRTY